jgi:hypothetical protein
MTKHTGQLVIDMLELESVQLACFSQADGTHNVFGKDCQPFRNVLIWLEITNYIINLLVTFGYREGYKMNI